MAFLEVNDVIKLYKPGNDELQVPALRGIDLEINEKDLVTIIGPSGSGKTTLLKLIGGLEKPNSGTIYMEDVGLINNLSKKALAKYRQKNIGFMYQYPEQNLLASVSALNNVLFPMKILGKLNRTEMKKRAEHLLEMVGLKRKLSLKLGQLSGGEAQRTSIAVALANDPKLILADEPTGELDSENTFQVIEYFKELHDTLGTSFLVVTHDERFANLTSNTYKLKDGRIHGLHRSVDLGKNIDQFEPVYYRENVTLIDRFGNVTIPEEILKEMKFTNEVRIIADKDEDVIKLVPIRKKHF